MSRSKRKSSSDVAGTAKKHQAIMMETKVKIIERVERCEKMVDVAHSYTCYHVLYDEKKRATTQTSLDRFFKRADRIESSKEPDLCHQCQAWVKLQFALRLLLLTILQLYRLPPHLPPPVSNSSCLFTRCQPLYASCWTVPLYLSRYCTVRLKMFYFLCLFVFYVLFVWKVL